MFNGYLLKLDGRVLPLKFIQPSTYSCAPNQTLDEDSYTDADGVLRRNILPHKRTKIEFNTPHIYERNMTELRTFIQKRDKVTVEYFNTSTGLYASGAFYLVDPEFTIAKIDNDIVYEPIRIALIEY